MEMDWNTYKGKVVSVLITGKDDKTENYIRAIEDITDDGFMILNPNNPNFNIAKIIFRIELIKSVWIYSDPFPP